MATIDDVYNLLQQNNPFTSTKYAISNDFVFNARAQFGLNGLRDAFEAIYNIQGNVNDIEAAQATMTVKVNEMYLAVVTADIAGKINQVYASIYTELLETQLAPLNDKLDTLIAAIQVLGTNDDSWDGGQKTIAGLLLDVLVDEANP